MTTKSITLNNGIKCAIYARNPPVTLLNLVSVDRASNAEIGPTEFLGNINAKMTVVIRAAPQGDHVTIRKSKTPFVHTRGTTSLHVVYEPLITRPTWVFKNDPRKVSDGSNVFGASGVVRFNRKTSLQIPFVNALDVTAGLYRDFGVRLIPFGEPLPPMKHKTSFVSYELGDKYVKKYVHSKSGPGIFLEHHKFTHLLTPATPTTHGPIVVGKLMRGGATKLIGVDVPYGYTLIIPGGCLHNDWYVVGKISTTIALDDQAKTAFVRGKDSKKIAMDFVRKFVSK